MYVLKNLLEGIGIVYIAFFGGTTVLIILAALITVVPHGLLIAAILFYGWLACLAVLGSCIACVS
jgi:hypothetical protein